VDNLWKGILSMEDETKHILDFASIFTAIGTVLQWLPYLAALFTIIWTGIRIYETATVQTVLKNRQAKKDKKAINDARSK
tara:strand:+ start:440 stop:679 length:240 start_codon:yes stop_codon:yes gene_type:complete